MRLAKGFVLIMTISQFTVLAFLLYVDVYSNYGHQLVVNIHWRSTIALTQPNYYLCAASDV
jgi:hypothetical protein